jgi:hypothetical protein
VPEMGEGRVDYTKYKTPRRGAVGSFRKTSILFLNTFNAKDGNPKTGPIRTTAGFEIARAGIGGQSSI